MNREKTGISTKCVENHMGRKATLELIRAIEDKNAPPVAKPKEHCGINMKASGESTANKEE